MQGTFRVGDWSVEPQLNTITGPDKAAHVEPKIMQVLVCLAENAGQVVTKELLMRSVWADTFVSDDVLTRSISELRRVFGDDAKEPRFIQTIPRRGYRLIAPVVDDGVKQETETGEARAAEKATPARRRRLKWLNLLFLVASAMLVVTGLVYGLLLRGTPATKQPEIKSLAVLPLDNFSGDPTQEYLADGMTDALITELSKIGSLRVISRTSVMQYKAARKPLPELARELNVDMVVTGSVQRSGDKLGITAQLIRATDDRHLWANQYERDLRDLLSLQREIARAIAGEIDVKLTPKEERLLASARPVNPAALDAYLRGCHYCTRGSDLIGQQQGIDLLKTSIGYFEQAVRIDPEFALGYAGLAMANTGLVAIALSEFHQPAKEAATRALQLDETLSDAHGSLAFLLTFDRDWAGAEREFKRAIELNPSDSGARMTYAVHLTFLGRHDEAIREIDLAQELDPLSIIIKVTAANLYLMARQHDRAIEQYRRLLDTQPNNFSLHLWLGEAYMYKGMHGEGIAELRKASELSGGAPGIRALLAWGYAVSGNRSEAIKILDERVKWLSNGGPSLKVFIAAAYTALGDQDQAFAWLEKAYQEHSLQLILLKIDPMLVSLRSDPRYADLLRRLRFPE